MKSQRDKVKELLDQSSMITSAQSVIFGINTKTLSRMVNDGEIQRIARGIYTSSDYLSGAYHSLMEASKLNRNGVICLLSALSFHEIGTQNPSEVWLAIPRGSRIPQINDRPIQITIFSGTAYSSGIEEKTVDGVKIKVYSIAKTIADCFKYRNKIGLDIAIEALKDVVQNKRSTIEDLLHFAGICRVKKIMGPYLESIV